MRFKELDLRLVQWKLFLPERWREACALNADGNMDPNLTLAHITHNIAVVLLHQGIAYLSPEWQASPIRLPSASSAETCLAAATEVAIIADRFLQGTTIPTNPQFAFCLFICGRMFLAHAAYYAVPVPPEFDSLVDSLREISRRWNGSYAAASSTAGENLASKFATRLIQARQLGPGAVDIRQTAYSEEHQQQHQHQHQQHQQQQQQQQKLPRQQQDLMTPMETRVGGPSSYVGGVNTDSNGLSGSSRGYVRVGASPRAPPPPMMEPAAQGSSNLNGSPDSISLAFPPLPLAFNSTNSALATAMPSPHPDTLQPSSPPPGYGAPPEGHYMGGDAHAGGDACLEPGAAGGTGFEDLRSFLEYSFLPTQRVSMFSNHSSMGR
ncbi:hypothetical protein VTK73DRAFT_4148 [Phialemonium thermophilum]|uniref:Uncharacterized protein n=1 Tax=Phialemonium thermophilum TaxID=223376 RepID=A0ABR3VB21_9PEZI